MDISLGATSPLSKMTPVTSGDSTNWSSVTTDPTERDVADIAKRSFQYSPYLPGGGGSPLLTARDSSPTRIRAYSTFGDSSMGTLPFGSPLTVGAASDREPTPPAAIPAGPQTPNASTGACSPKDDLDDLQFVDVLGAIAAAPKNLIISIHD